MFARTVNVLPVIALIVGTACKGWDNVDYPYYFYQAVALGANVVPVTTDTSPRAMVSFNPNTGGFAYSVPVAPSGTIDSIAFYQVAAGVALPASATAVLCANAGVVGAPTCSGSGSGTVQLIPPATLATIGTSMHTYGTQVVIFTTAAQKGAGGAMRGTIYPTPAG